jgi:hypothetical protein
MLHSVYVNVFKDPLNIKITNKTWMCPQFYWWLSITFYRHPIYRLHASYLSLYLLLLLLVFWVVILCVFTFWVQCFDVRCNFCIKTMFASSLPPVVCRRIHVLLTLFCVSLRIAVSNTYCVVFLLWLFSSGILYIAIFSGLSIFDCHFGFHIFFTTFYET